MAEKRTGIFGGIFDPVHVGHWNVARAALRHLALQKLYIVPSRLPPHKPKPALGPADRLLLLRAAFAGSPAIEISDIELRRGGTSYTCETLAHFRKAAGGKLFFIIGADNVPEIPSWREPRRILELAVLAVAGRPGFGLPVLPPAYRGKMVPLPVDPADISSTVVRQRLAAGRDVSAWVPKPALDLILEKGWYGPA